MPAALALVIALLTAVIIHEAAHAVAMNKAGFRVTQAGLGLPAAPRLRFQWRGVEWSASIWLLGAYVGTSADDAQRLEKLPYHDRAWILNAGIVANLVSGFALLAAGLTLEGHLMGAAIASGLAVVVWAARRPVASLLLPALAIPSLILLAVSLASILFAGDGRIGYAGMSDLVPAGFTLVDLVVLAGQISVALALLNMVPIGPLDNARVCAPIIEKVAGATARRWFDRVGLGTLVVLTLASISSDLYAVGRAMIG